MRTALENMTWGLEQWDETLRASEVALKAELPRAEPALAARMHVAVGAAYLDRTRVADALREFETASRLDSSRADVFTFQGLAHAQLGNDPGRAVPFLRKAAALEPSNPISAYLLGRALSQSGKEAEARQVFQTVLRSWRESVAKSRATPDTPFIRLSLVQERSGAEPFFPPVLYEEGFALLRQGEFSKALEAFGRAAVRDPLVANAVDPREAIGLAATAFRDGATDAAARHLRVAIELDPNRAEAHRLFGRVLLADRHDEEALKELQLAIRLAPGDERARLDLSDAFVELRRYPDAERALRDAIQVFPTSGRAHYKLARVYQRQNQSLEALSEFQAAVKEGPLIGLNRILQAIGAINVTQQDFAAAVEAYSTRADIHPNDPEAHEALGLTYSRIERNDEALAEFAVALVLRPGWPNIYVAMSQLYMRQGDVAAAADAAREAVNRDPTHRQARYALASALTRLDRPDEARREFDEYERLQADETAAFSRQMTINGMRREASVRSDNHEYERAVGLLRNVLDLAPDAASHLELGVALLKSGQPAEALDHLKAAEKLEESLEVHQQLADAYEALGETEDSRREMATYQQLRREKLRRASADR